MCRRGRPRLLLMVSQHGHCLNDLLFRWQSGRSRSTSRPSCPTTERFAAWPSYGIPFHHLPLPGRRRADPGGAGAAVMTR
jgi:formyltetrahydrofolate deformylase